MSFRSLALWVSGLCLFSLGSWAMQDRPPDRNFLKWLADNAKAKGETSLNIAPPIVDYAGSNINLSEAMAYFDVVVAVPLERSVLVNPSGNQMRTWYKFKLVERLHHTPKSLLSHSVSVPKELPSLQPDEFWVSRPGGAVTIDDVVVSQPVVGPFELSKRYVLFVAYSANGIVDTAGGAQGMFALDEHDNLQAVTTSRHILQNDVESKTGNSLPQLKDFIQKHPQ